MRNNLGHIYFFSYCSLLYKVGITDFISYFSVKILLSTIFSSLSLIPLIIPFISLVQRVSWSLSWILFWWVSAPHVHLFDASILSAIALCKGTLKLEEYSWRCPSIFFFSILVGVLASEPLEKEPEIVLLSPRSFNAFPKSFTISLTFWLSFFWKKSKSRLV